MFSGRSAAIGPTEPDQSERIPAGIWVLIAAGLVIALGFGLIAPALPSLAQSFDVSMTSASLVVSAFAAMRLIFAPAAGWLTTRLGERRIYLTGLLIVAASSFLIAAAQAFPQLLVFRSLGGIGSTMFSVSSMALLIRIAPPHMRGRVSAAYASSFVLGNVAGPVVGGLLVGQGLRLPFIVYGIALVIAVAVVALALPRELRSAAAGTTAPEPPLVFRVALGDARYRAALVGAVTNGWTFSMRMAVLPLFVVNGLGESASVASYVLAAYALGDIATMIPAGRAADRYGRKPPLIAGLSLLVLATAALAATDSLWVTVVATFLAGAGTGAIAPAMQATVADVIGTRRGGGALAGFQMSQDVGSIVGPLVTGLIADRAGFGPAFAVSAMVAAVALAVWIRTPVVPKSIAM